MSLFVECKPDETLACAIGIPRRDIEHALGKARVCAQLEKRTNVLGMVDEDPGSAAHSYTKSLVEQSWGHDIREMTDKARNNRVIVLSPRLEEWLVQSSKGSGLKMTDFGFESDNGLQLHAEINQRLENLQRLVDALIEAKSQRVLRLQALLMKK